MTLSRKHKIFIHYCSADENWAEENLLKSLSEFDESIATPRSFTPGLFELDEIEEALHNCELFLFIATPNSIDDSKANFGEILASTSVGDTEIRKIVPIIAEDCKLPKRLESRVLLPCRNEKERSISLGRLRSQIGAILNPGVLKNRRKRLRQYFEIALHENLSDSFDPSDSAAVLPTRAVMFSSTDEIRKLHFTRELNEAQLKKTQICSVEELMQYLVAEGDLVIHAPGGYGKTFVAHKLLHLANREGMIPYVVRSDNWTRSKDLKEAAATKKINRIQFLKAICSNSQSLRKMLAQEPIERTFVVLIDGFNELPVDSWERHLVTSLLNDTDDENHPIRLIVTSRVAEETRDTLPNFQGKVFSLLPLEDEVVRTRIQHLPEDSSLKELFRIPLFLSLIKHARLPGNDSRLRVDIIEQYLARVLFSSESSTGRKDYLSELSRALFKQFEKGYRKSGTFLISKTELLEDISIDASKEDLERLFSGELFVPNATGRKKFICRHDILQFGLIGHRLAELVRKAWENRKVGKPMNLVDFFSIATLRKRSFDAIVYAAEWLDRMDLGSESDDIISQYIECVYDWDYHAAIEVVIDLLQHTTGNEGIVPESIKLALQAVSAEKKFDNFKVTAEKALERAKRFDAVTGEEYALSNSREQLLEFAKRKTLQLPSDQWFADWARAYRGEPEDDDMDELDIDLLTHQHSLVGWTAANVFRRGRINNSDVQRLRGLCQTKIDKTAIWRITHVLGGATMFFPAAASLASIITSKGYSYAREGAARSLVELVGLRDTEPEFKRSLAFLNEVRKDLSQNPVSDDDIVIHRRLTQLGPFQSEKIKKRPWLEKYFNGAWDDWSSIEKYELRDSEKSSVKNWAWKFAMDLAKCSPDKNSVGCVVLDNDAHWRATGFNRFPKNIEPLQERKERPEKYQWIEHAERIAIGSAASEGISLSGCHMFSTRFPCIDCARMIIETEISRLTTIPPELDHEKWGREFVFSKPLLEEAGVEIELIRNFV